MCVLAVPGAPMLLSGISDISGSSSSSHHRRSDGAYMCGAIFFAPFPAALIPPPLSGLWLFAPLAAVVSGTIPGT